MNGLGLEGLEAFRNEWSRDRDLLFRGGEEVILGEVHRKADECSSACSDDDALEVFEKYMDKKK